MFKKLLFVFLLAAAVITLAGYSVPTASACSTTSDCRPLFGTEIDDAKSDGSIAPAMNAAPVDGFQYVQPLTGRDRDNTDFASVN